MIWDYLIPVDRNRLSFRYFCYPCYFALYTIIVLLYSFFLLVYQHVLRGASPCCSSSAYFRLPLPLRTFWEISFQYHSAVKLTEILYNAYSFLCFYRWARILRQSILGIFTSRFLKPIGLSACVWNNLRPSQVHHLFFLLWYSSIFPCLYFRVFLISICFK